MTLLEEQFLHSAQEPDLVCIEKVRGDMMLERPLHHLRVVGYRFRGADCYFVRMMSGGESRCNCGAMSVLLAFNPDGISGLGGFDGPTGLSVA